MNFETRTEGKITVFRLSESRLDANISGLMKTEVNRIVREGAVKKLIIDLSMVENCDSSGLSVLLVANRLMGSENGLLRIVTTSDKILSLVKITKLNRVLNLNDTVEEALAELNEV